MVTFFEVRACCALFQTPVRCPVVRHGYDRIAANADSVVHHHLVGICSPVAGILSHLDAFDQSSPSRLLLVPVWLSDC